MEDIIIEVEETPNPKALKFILNKPVKTSGKITYKSTDQCNEPLAADILNIKHINQVHFFDNVISVSQDGNEDWAELTPQVEAVIRTRLPIHDPDFITEAPLKKISPDLPPEVQAIEEILDRTVRPGLRADGGDLEVLRYEGDVLTVNFQGACGSCPSSTMGTLYAIEGILQKEFNPNIQVRPGI